MKLQSHRSSFLRKLSGGFTLVEMMIAIGIGVVVVGAVIALTMVSAVHFLAMTNYVSMDDQSRNALDQISREVRNASALMSFSTNNPQSLVLTNATLGQTTTLTYNSTTGSLTMAKTGQGTQTLLTGCDTFSFQLFDRYPITNTVSFYASTNYATGKLDPTFCKVIDMDWKCSRTILGSKLNTEIVQTAEVVLRNQVSK